MFPMGYPTNNEGDVKRIVSELAVSNSRGADSTVEVSPATPILSGVSVDETVRISPDKAFKARLNIVDLDEDLRRNWNVAVEGGPRKSFAVDVDTDPRKRWTFAGEGGPRRSFAMDPVDISAMDLLARKSISLEGIWQGEAEPRRSFGYEPQEAPMTPGRFSWSVDMPPRRSADGKELRAKRNGEGDKWRSKSTAFLAFPEERDKCLSLEVNKLNVMPPLNENAEVTLKQLGTLPVSINFDNIEYRVSTEFESSWMDVKSWGQKLRRSTREKVILHGISGAVHPGEMMGMLGPSGSGKTSLLEILAGRTLNYEGTITHNGVPFVKSMNRRTGLVTQDDILYAHLTVKETLACAALLRLPRESSRKEKIQRAQDVILELGLDRCQNTIVGGPYVRGVSGGERKRVSIGCEMLTDPSLLLLDEPSSGLDSTTALSIVRILRSLAHGGKTIISTIHQPSSVIYHMFDKVLLLSEGQPLFHGKGSGALDYFESIGFHPTFATNPADFLLDLANGVTHNLEDLNREYTTSVSIKRRAKEQVDERNHVKKILKEAYVAHVVQEGKFENIDLKPKTPKKIDVIRDTYEKREWSTSWMEQFTILSRRALKERKHESFSAPRILETLLVAIIAGLIWWDSSDRIEDQVGLLFFSSTIWGFFPLFNSIFTFPQERDMLHKERASGMYRLSAYFFAQSTVDVPMELVLPTVYMIIVYWMGGLKATFVAFLATWAAVLANVLVAQGLGLAIGAICMNLKHASTLASVMMLSFLLVGGFYNKDISPTLRWLKYTSFSYHGFKLELNAQFGEDDLYPCSTGQCRVADIDSVATVGLGGILASALAMLASFIGFRFIAYISLRRTKA